MRKITLLLFLCLMIVNIILAQTSPVIKLKWVDTKPLKDRVGVSWGVSFAIGTIKKDQSFTISDAEGKTKPVQSWPTAYWPDGSVKWSGFATVAGAIDGPLTLSVSNAKTTSAEGVLQVKYNVQAISINTGELNCVRSKSGKFILDSVIVNGRLIGSKGRLECVKRIARISDFLSFDKRPLQFESK